MSTIVPSFTPQRRNAAIRDTHELRARSRELREHDSRELRARSQQIRERVETLRERIDALLAPTTGTPATHGHRPTPADTTAGGDKA